MTARLPVTRRALLSGAGALLVLPRGAFAAGLKADYIVVTKAARRLDLLSHGEIVASYPIRLGVNPVGPKIFELDGRTPEGIYTIDRRSRNTPYHRALHISYPQAENRARAAQYRLPPGGAIFIHGTPGRGRRFERDWTDGCIAVSNRAIEDIWNAVADGTPIEIRP